MKASACWPLIHFGCFVLEAGLGYQCFPEQWGGATSPFPGTVDP